MSATLTIEARASRHPARARGFPHVRRALRHDDLMINKRADGLRFALDRRLRFYLRP